MKYMEAITLGSPVDGDKLEADTRDDPALWRLQKRATEKETQRLIDFEATYPHYQGQLNFRPMTLSDGTVVQIRWNHILFRHWYILPYEQQQQIFLSSGSAGDMPSDAIDRDLFGNDPNTFWLHLVEVFENNIEGLRRGFLDGIIGSGTAFLQVPDVILPQGAIYPLRANQGPYNSLSIAYTMTAADALEVRTVFPSVASFFNQQGS